MKNTKPKRKPIVKKGWAILWPGGNVTLTNTKREGLLMLDGYWKGVGVLFRCEIREIVK